MPRLGLSMIILINNRRIFKNYKISLQTMVKSLLLGSVRVCVTTLA